MGCAVVVGVLQLEHVHSTTPCLIPSTSSIPHRQALTKLDDYGFIQSRPKGEYHANNQVRARVPWETLCLLVPMPTTRWGALGKAVHASTVCLCLEWSMRGAAGQSSGAFPSNPTCSHTCLLAHPTPAACPPDHPSAGHVQAAAQGHRPGRAGRGGAGRVRRVHAALPGRARARAARHAGAEERAEADCYRGGGARCR